MRRRRLQVAPLGFALLVLLAGCTGDKSARAPEVPVTESTVSLLENRPWAVDFEGEARLLDELLAAIAETSGGRLITRSDANELGDPSLFMAAPIILHAEVTSAARGYYATGHIRHRASVLDRASAAGRSAGAALRALGRALGRDARIRFINGEFP